MQIDERVLSTVLLSLLMLSIAALGSRDLQVIAQLNPSLTGKIYDKGIDTDADGHFDYLEVGVEVNVSEPGFYRICASGLEDSGYVYLYASEDLRLDVGLHVVNLTFYGPTIYSSRIDPENVSSITIYENPDEFGGTWLGTYHDIRLSRQYFYDEFDAPFADMEAKFSVYPDGRVVMGGTLNYTEMAPPYEGNIDIIGDASFTAADGSREMLADFALTVQPQLEETFPFNSSSFNLAGTYSGGMADIDINGSVTFPASIASQFPLNLSDFTVTAKYLDDEINGTITAPLISGVPVTFIDVDFHGNLTDLYLSDEIEIAYGTFFESEVNETMVEELLLHINSTIPGTGLESLYNATDGMLECTGLNTVMNKRIDGATIAFDAHIHGDFVEAFVFFMTEGRGDPGLRWFADALVNSIETGDFKLGYAHQYREASMELSFTANLSELWIGLESTLPEEIPPESRAPLELLLNTTMCSVDSADVAWTYENGRSDLHIDAMIGADFKAELNFIKHVMTTYGMPQPPPFPWAIINETEIDLSNLSVTFNLTRTSVQGAVDGFEVMPPIDAAGFDAPQFMLKRFFNLTSSDGEPPTRDSKLKITIEAGYNSTHTVILFKPATVPEPDMTSLNYKTMAWENLTVSSLKDLLFRIAYQEVFDYVGQTFDVLIFTNSTMSNFAFSPTAKSIGFNVTGTTGTGFCNVTIPRSLLNASLAEWTVRIDGHSISPLEFSVTENSEYVFIYLNYSHSSHLIEIQGTWVITEFPPNILPLLLVITSLAATAIALRQRKRLGELRVKYQSKIHLFADRLHRLKA